MRKLLVQLLVMSLWFVVLFLPTTNYQPGTIYAQNCTTTGTPVVSGLVTTPSIGGVLVNSAGACAIDPKSALLPFKIPSFEEMKSLYYDQPALSLGITKHNPQNGNASENAISMTTGSDHVYYIKNGSLSIDGNIPGPGTQTGVIFIDNNLNINSQLTYGSGNSGLVFVVKGNVYISNAVTRIDAVIISEGTICTASIGSSCPTSNITASPLIINGSLISLNANNPIKFRRTLINNNRQPAEKINHQVKYLVILRHILSDTFQRWSEIDASTPISTPIPTSIPTVIPALDAGLAGYWKFDETSGAIATDSSVNGNDGILTGPLIGNFENTPDGFSLDCGGQPTSSYVTGKIGKGIKIWSTGGDGFACGSKAISSIPNGYSVYFYGKGYVKSVFYGPNDTVGSTSYLEDVQTGCKTPNGKSEIFAYCNNKHPYTDWKLFKLTAFKDGGVTMNIYAKWPGTTEDVAPQQYNLSSGLGEEYAGYYDYITTGPSWNTGGTSNGALSFNGTDNFVRINNSSALTSSLNITSSFTISLWVKPAANQNNGYPTLVSRHLGITPGAQYQLGLSSSGTTHKIRFCSESNNPESNFGCQVGNGILTNDRWNHLAVTFNAGERKLNYYLNGALDKQFNLTGLPNYQANVIIGATTVGSSWGWYFKGLLDEVKIYNYARTETQIAQDANATTTIPAPITSPTSTIRDLKAYYPNPDLYTTYYLEGFTYVTNPASRAVLWFEDAGNGQFKQYNWAPEDTTNSRCHWDKLGWTTDSFLYYESGDKCRGDNKTYTTLFSPPMVYSQRYWDESLGAGTLIANTTTQTDYIDGVERCHKTNSYTNQILGREQISPGVTAIHIRTNQTFTSSTCGDTLNAPWQENYYLIDALPILGGSTAKGFKRTVGGNPNNPWLWDIWFDNWKRLP